MIKPIVSFDIESTGINPLSDRIVEIAIYRDPTGEKLHHYVNPAIPIPKEASEIHGIYDKDVVGKPLFREIADQIIAFCKDCDIAGFNSNMFDVPMLFSQLHFDGFDTKWLSDANLLDAGVIYKRNQPRTLGAAYQHFTGDTLDDAHTAMADTEATAEVFLKMTEVYELEALSREELASYCNYDKPRADVSGKFFVDDDGDYCYNFGKHKGTKAKLERGFAGWMLGKDFLPDTLDIAKEIYYGK